MRDAVATRGGSLFDIVFHIIRDWRGYHRRPMVEALAKNCEGVAKLLVVEPTLCLPTCALKSVSHYSACPRLPRRELGLPSVNEKCRPSEFARCYRLPRREQISENLYVLRPLALIPYVYPLSRVVPLSRTYRAKQIRDALRDFGFTAPRFAYINHPYSARLVGVAQETHLVYECRDEYSVSDHGMPDPHRQMLELQLLKQADVVFAASEALHTKMSRLHHNAHFLSNGVDFGLFSGALSDASVVPEELCKIPSPRIGYVGGVSEPIVDFGLLEYLSRVRPQWSFVLIGPSAGVPESIKKSPNIHLLGTRPHEEVPQHLKGMDVAMSPFVRNRYTDDLNPLKIWEYLAAGKLVVTTDAVQGQSLRDIVFIASNREQFLSYLEQALSGDHSLRVKQGIALAREHSWLQTTKEVPRILAEVVSNHNTCIDKLYEGPVRETNV